MSAVEATTTPHNRMGWEDRGVRGDELRVLLSREGQRLLDELPPYGSSADVVATVSRLRAAGHPPDLVAAVLSQSRLRSRAHAKFGEFAERMLFTEAGLEQATRLAVAARHAGRFARAGVRRVADLGCGIGADALAIAALGIEVVAVDRDEVTAAIAAHNLAPFPNARVEWADAATFAATASFTGSGSSAASPAAGPATGTSSVADFDGVYLDPARRSEHGRLRDPADWSPPLGFAFEHARAARAGGVKLGPGIDRGLIPGDCEAQWVSVDHEVVELGLWFGAAASEGVGRSALVIGAEGSAELTAAADSEDVEAGPLGEFLYEPDGAVIRARLIGDLARTIGARTLHPQIAYLTADTATETPFATRFRIRESLSFDVRTLRRELAARGIGVLEIKKRGVDIDPAVLRTKLALRGSERATLIVTRLGERRVALLADRD